MASTQLPLLLSGCAGISQVSITKRKQPNIVLFLTDDQRFDTICALGNNHIITPNMDSLVREGTTFTNACIMGSNSGAVCIPSRAMLLSGRTLFHLQGQGNIIPPEHITFPEVLREAGYTTFHTGKWHQDPKSTSRCFSDGAKIFFGGMTDQFNVPVFDFDPAGKYPKENRYIEKDKHSSELFSDSAIAFLRNCKKDRPFFLYIAYTAPHDPRCPPAKYLDMYDPDKITLPESFMPRHPFDNGEMEVRDEKLASWPRTPQEIRKHIAEYYAMITHLDTQIGRVLAALKQTSHYKNTIIIFAADNGLAVGRHGLMGKQNLYEHSIRVPLVIAGPGIPKGRRCNAFCYLLDIYPTLCELVGLPVPSVVEGHSLIPLINNPDSLLRDTLFFAYKDVQRAVRDERYKLIEYMVNGKRTTQLFDLQLDGCEVNNLADSPSHSEHLRRLRKELVRWKNELGDNSTFWQTYGTSL